MRADEHDVFNDVNDEVEYRRGWSIEYRSGLLSTLVSMPEKKGCNNEKQRMYKKNVWNKNIEWTSGDVKLRLGSSVKLHYINSLC